MDIRSYKNKMTQPPSSTTSAVPRSPAINNTGKDTATAKYDASSLDLKAAPNPDLDIQTSKMVQRIIQGHQPLLSELERCEIACTDLVPQLCCQAIQDNSLPAMQWLNAHVDFSFQQLNDLFESLLTHQQYDLMEPWVPYLTPAQIDDALLSVIVRSEHPHRAHHVRLLLAHTNEELALNAVRFLWSVSSSGGNEDPQLQQEILHNAQVKMSTPSCLALLNNSHESLSHDQRHYKQKLFAALDAVALAGIRSYDQCLRSTNALDIPHLASNVLIHAIDINDPQIVAEVLAHPLCDPEYADGLPLYSANAKELTAIIDLLYPRISNIRRRLEKLVPCAHLRATFDRAQADQQKNNLHAALTDHHSQGHARPRKM